MVRLPHGSAGLAIIKSRGGVALVQDPADALHAAMPRSAIAHVTVDAILRCEDLASAIRHQLGPPSGGAMISVSHSSKELAQSMPLLVQGVLLLQQISCATV